MNETVVIVTGAAPLDADAVAHIPTGTIVIAAGDEDAPGLSYVAPYGAMAMAESLAAQDRDVLVVFDGRPQAHLEELAGGNLSVAFARRSGRDAADDRIVELVDERYADEPAITVVTSDRGLVGRLPPGVEVEGAGAFRRRLSP